MINRHLNVLEWTTFPDSPLMVKNSDYNVYQNGRSNKVPPSYIHCKRNSSDLKLQLFWFAGRNWRYTSASRPGLKISFCFEMLWNNVFGSTFVITFVKSGKKDESNLSESKVKKIDVRIHLHRHTFSLFRMWLQCRFVRLLRKTRKFRARNWWIKDVGERKSNRPAIGNDEHIILQLTKSCT